MFGVLALLFVAGIIVATPWAFGGVQVQFQFWIFVAVLISLVGCWIDLATTGRSRPVVLPIAIVPLLLAIGLGLFQLAPLNGKIHRLLSPQSAYLWRELTGESPSDPASERPFAPSTTQAGASDGHDGGLDHQSDLSVATNPYPISLYPASTRHDLFRLILCTSVFLMGVLLFRPMLSHLSLLWIVAINGLALAFFGLVQQLSWNGQLFWSVPLTKGGAPFSSFVCKNNAGGYLNICLAAAIGLLVWCLSRSENRHALGNAMSPWDRVLYAFSRLNGKTLAALVMAGFIAAGILCSLSRGAVVAMVGAGAITVLATRASRGFRTGAPWLLTVVGIAALVLVGWIGRSDAVQQRLSTLLTEREVVVEQRLPHWKDGLRAAGEFWALGSGLGTYRYVYRLYEQTPSEEWFYHAENQYIEAFLEGGILGLALMLAMIALVAVACVRLLRQGPEGTGYALGVAGVFALTSQVIASLFDFGLYIPANALLFALICGLIVGSAENLKSGDSQSMDVAGRAPVWRSSSALRGRTVAASLVALLAFAVWLGLIEVRRGIAYESVRSDATELLGSVDPADELPRKVISSVHGGLAECPDDARAQQLSANLWIHLYRAQKTRNDSGTKADERNTKAMWESTSLYYLHGAAHRFYRTNRDVDLQKLIDDPVVQRNLTRAVEDLISARRACPLLSTVHVRLAELASVVDDPSTDRFHLRRARQLAPADPSLLFYVGLLELQAGRTEAACASWRRCLEVAPSMVDAILDCAAGNMALAECADRLLPDSPELLIRVARDRLSGREYSDVRLALSQRANRLIRESDLAEDEKFYLTGSMLALNNQHGKAMQLVGRAVELRPERTAWRYELARLMRQQGLVDQARQEVGRCVRMEPDNERYAVLLRELIRTGLISGDTTGPE